MPNRACRRQAALRPFNEVRAKLAAVFDANVEVRVATLLTTGGELPTYRMLERASFIDVHEKAAVLRHPQELVDR